MKYDVMILGGGPGGYSAAIQLAKNKKKVALIEKNHLGGTCLNVGCIPTKALAENAMLLDKIRLKTNKNILKDAGQFSWRNIVKEKDESVEKLVLGLTMLINTLDIDVYFEEGLIESENTIKLQESNKTLEGDNIIIATGAETFYPNIEGIEHVIDSTAALSLDRLPHSLAIIGGGVIGVEMASIFNGFGVNVTVYEATESILNYQDTESVSKLKSILEDKGIEIQTSTTIKQIQSKNSEKYLKIFSNGVASEAVFDEILLCVGRKPRINDNFIKALGIVIKNGVIKTNDFMQTNISNIYAIGDIASNVQLAHLAYKHADLVVDHILNRSNSLENYLVPNCIYSNPQFASVGDTEDYLKNKNKKYKKQIVSFNSNGKAIVEDDTLGFVKILYDDSDKILGCNIVSNDAVEIVHTVMVAMESDLSATSLGKLIFAHPSKNELVKECCLKTTNNAVHIL